MALGVLNNLAAVYAENNLNNTSSSLNTVLQQLSSGSKINSGADDSAGLSLVNGLKANQQALSQSQTNALEGVGLLQVADGALSQVTNLLNRAVTLATEAANGTLNPTQDTAANQEYQSILSEISNIGSTTTYNQQQVFNSKTNIYTGDSSQAGSSINVLNIRALSASNVGDSNGVMQYSTGQNNVFLNLSSATANASVNDSLNASGSTTINVSYVTQSTSGQSVNATAAITVGAGTTYANTAQGLMSAINNSGLGLTATFATATQAGTAAVAAAAGSGTQTGILITGQGVGAGSQAGEIGTLSVNAATDTLSGTLNVKGSDGQVHAVTLGTAGATDTIANLANTLNASGFGLSASVSGTTLTMDSSNSAVSVSGSGITDQTTSTSISLGNVPSTASQISTQAGSTLGTLSITGGAAGDTLGAGAFYVTGANGATTTFTVPGSGTTLATLAASVNTANLGVQATVSGTTLTFTATSADSQASVAMKTAFTDSTTGAATVALAKASGAPPNAEYYSIGLSSTSGITDTTTSVTVGNTSLGSSTNRAFVSDFNGSNGTATISYTDGAGADLSSTDLLNQTNAQASLTALNKAIAAVAAQDGYIGAQINTLNAISQVLSTQQENIQSAQNAVQATDYASATSNMSKYEILSQTGISALAQANSMQQEVLKLLQ